MSCRGPGASGGWKGSSTAWVGGSNGWVGSRGSWEVSGVEAGLGWRLDGLAADDLGMVVLVQLSPRKRLKVVCELKAALDLEENLDKGS